MRAELSIVEKNLRWMRLGGIYDHFGFGITGTLPDSRWRFPHFEKMLYDQATVTIACWKLSKRWGEDFTRGR